MKSLFKSLSNPLFFAWGQSLAVTLASLTLAVPAFGEGSQQLGIGSQGLNVYLYEYDAANQFIQGTNRGIRVNVESPNQVINISLCGWSYGASAAARDDLAIEVFRPSGTEINYATQVALSSPGSFLATAGSGNGAWLLTQGNASTATQTTLCTNQNKPSSPVGQLTTPVRFVAPEAGTYEIRLYNDTESNPNSVNVLTYFDITVTSSTSVNPDPSANNGQVWASSWAFNAGNTFAITGGYDADLYVRTPGGRLGTEFIWQLDLNKFAPFKHEIVANSIGLNAPNSRASALGTSGATYTRVFPIYLSPPNSFSTVAPILPEPAPASVTNLTFVDNANVDNTISPNSTTGIQDSGFFKFNTDVAGAYTITIDTNSNGTFDSSDRVLFGSATAGNNSIQWDGKGVNNAVLTSGTYQTQVSIGLGEYHFITFDSETSGGGTNDGLSIWKWNGLSARTPALNFWDDTKIATGTRNLTGSLSNTPQGRHTWGDFSGTGIGNDNFIDTWVFSNSPAITTQAIITATDDDFGDAPDTGTGTGIGNYQTAFSDNGPRHTIVNGIKLGANIDLDSGTLQNANADADDTNGTPNDEDGVILGANSLQNQTLTQGANATLNITTQGSGVLNAWIDWNQDGDFLDSGEQVAINTAPTSNAIALPITVPGGASLGTTYARFRYSSQTGLASTGAASDGEVEDYKVAIAAAIADLSLTKIVNNASPNVGDNVTFTVTLSNAGPNSATGINVADLLPTGLTFVSATPSQGTYNNTTGVWTVGTVASATSTTLQIVATVTTAGAKTNTAQVSASAQTDPDSTPNNNVAGEDDQASVTVTPPTADLSIIKTDSPDPVIAGANLTYAIAVTNNGSVTAANAVMSDPLPSGTTFQSITTPPGWTCTTPAVGSNGTVSCTNPSFAVGSANFTLVVRVAPTTANNSSLSNTATISSATFDTNTGNNSSFQTTTVQQSADLSLTKVSTPASPAVGGSFNYTITVTNDGPSIATNVRVKDALPVGIGYVLNTPSQGTYDSVATKVWDVGTLNPGASATLVISAIRSDTSITINTAEVIAADQPDPDSPHNNQVAGEDDQASVTVPSQSVDLAVSKTVNNPTPNVGDNVTFTITATNLTASTTATNVGLSDILPLGLTYQSNTASTGTYNTGTGVWSIASLNSGTPATLTITATVTTSGAKTNTAQLSALDQTDSNANNNSSSATVTPTSTPPNLLLVKRITAINGVDVTGFQDGVNTPGNPNNVGTKAAEDNNAFWPTPNTTSLRGAINSAMIAPTISLKPGDEVEYTIYFLSNGAAQAGNVSVCDFVPANQTYVSTGYNSSSISADAGGFSGSNYGVAIQSANGATPVKATNAGDGDRGQFYNSGFPASCIGTNSGRGAVVVNLGNVPNATSAGTPANSYGFIRFKAKIN